MACEAFADVQVGDLFLTVAQCASNGRIPDGAVVVIVEVADSKNGIRVRIANGSTPSSLMFDPYWDAEYTGECGRAALVKLVQVQDICGAQQEPSP